MTKDKFAVLDSFKVDGREGVYLLGTSYNDAVNEGISQLEKAPSDYEKIIIAFTDGEDTSSELSEDEILQRLLNENVRLYNISYGVGNFNKLKELSQASNGEFYSTVSSREFPFILQDIYLKMSNYFKITYGTSYCKDTHNVIIPINILKDSNQIKAKTSYYIKSDSNANIGDFISNNIEFESGQSNLSNINTLKEIERIANWMKDNHQYRIMIKGHTDNVGNDLHNIKLSKERALSVYRELVRLGVESNRIEINSFGDSMPLYENNSEENKQKNRRTEIEIIK